MFEHSKREIRREQSAAMMAARCLGGLTDNLGFEIWIQKGAQVVDLDRGCKF